MKNKNGRKKVAVGVVVGGVLGGAAYYLWTNTREHKKPLLDKLGRAVSGLGEILESSSIDNRKEAIREIEKTIPEGENTMNHILTWVATGINLWKKMRD